MIGRIFSRLAAGVALGVAPFALDANAPNLPEPARTAQVVFLGEQHDNPAHHLAQAEWVAALAPRALVFEMLTEPQARAATPDLRGDENALETALEWQSSGWPDFALYYPIFAAAPEAAIYGAGVPPDRVRGLMQEEVSQVAPELTARFGLDDPLPPEQQARRESLQAEAHCNALPETVLPKMVAVQRLRDAAIAGAALAALEQTGGPVVVITGNGHAREDWGAPFLLRAVAPQVRVFALGQGEAGQAPGGVFSHVVDGPAVDRGDPCAAFR